MPSMSALPAPASTDLGEYRRVLRECLPDELERMERTLRLARQSLAGPDPEAALGYLAELAERVNVAILTR